VRFLEIAAQKQMFVEPVKGKEAKGEMAAQTQVVTMIAPRTNAALPPFFSISDLSFHWRCSRASVYNIIRGETILDFATRGRRGKKLVPRELVEKNEQKRMRVW
jgi:hypothetical protein